MGFVLPEVVKKQQPTIPYSEMAQEALTVKKRKPKDISAIQKKMKASVERGQKQPWKDYTNIQLNLANELTCLDTLKTLDAAVDDAKKRVIYFSCLQGQVLQRLKDISRKKLPQL